MNSGERRIYGLIGYPVRHSLSPLMHNAAFRALEIDAEYKLFELKPQDLEAFFKSLPKENIYGLNVTIPHKEKVLPFLDDISSEAELIGAVNTIRVSHSRLEGFNTDGDGFLRHLKEDLRFVPAGKIIAIIGAGGAARAVSVYLSKYNPKAVTIYDIDKTKTLDLVSHLKENFKRIEFKAVNSPDELNIQTPDLLVNATPVGMKESDPCLVDEKIMHQDLLVYDLIYNPEETKLIKLAQQRGARTANGLGMLLYQGARSFELWTGRPAPVEIMRQALEGAVEKL